MPWHRRTSLIKHIKTNVHHVQTDVTKGRKEKQHSLDSLWPSITTCALIVLKLNNSHSLSNKPKVVGEKRFHLLTCPLSEWTDAFFHIFFFQRGVVLNLEDLIISVLSHKLKNTFRNEIKIKLCLHV